ncbi:high affinity immunoglobulin gamma Fc receptor I [Nothobranchius furzeri]|uniref:high affinity immunoglobulin gamma Fc receptor I n=1 Tax=Nothobranchius furzeri TaxID=105023 RepID=UPI003904931A
MEAPALCRHILITSFVLLTAQTQGFYTDQDHDAVLPEVFPDRLQFFEFESVSVRCEGVSGSSTQTVWKKLKTSCFSEACNSSAPSCTVNPAFERDSGEYWCGTGEGGQRGAVNISVTAGLVILDIPATPAAEGSNLTLRCIDKTSELVHITDFYKDGVYHKIGYKSHMTLQNISKSDEGRYKCSISGKGESPESWLAVVKPQTGPDEEAPHLRGQTKTVILLRVSLTAVLLLLIGVILIRKHKNTPTMLSCCQRGADTNNFEAFKFSYA